MVKPGYHFATERVFLDEFVMETVNFVNWISDEKNSQIKFLPSVCFLVCYLCSSYGFQQLFQLIIVISMFPKCSMHWY